MRKQSVINFIFGIIILILMALIYRFAIGGAEDDWRCKNGSWVRHGNPTEAMPSVECN